MNKKIVLFSAALAALATFNGCTSDDEIANNTTPETPVVKEAVPFGVSANMEDDTRANAITSFGDGATFYLTPYESKKGQPGTSGSWASSMLNAAYTYSSSEWSGPTSTWPSNGNVSWFYAHNLAGATPTFDPTTTTGSDQPTVTLSYTPAQTTSLIVNPHHKVTDSNDNVVDDFDEDDSDTYLTIANVVKPDNQLDLLYANELTGKDGYTNTDEKDINLTFKHALAKLRFKFKLNFSNGTSGIKTLMNNAANDNFQVMIYVTAVTLHNINTSGTLNLGTGEWSNQSNKGAVRVEFKTPIEMIINNSTVTDGYFTSDVGDVEMFVIPQTFDNLASKFNFTDIENRDQADGPVDEPYFSIDCIVAVDYNTENTSTSVSTIEGRVAFGDEDAGVVQDKYWKTMGTDFAYIALSSLGDKSFKAGKIHVFTLDFTYGMTWNYVSDYFTDIWGVAEASGAPSFKFQH